MHLIGLDSILCRDFGHRRFFFEQLRHDLCFEGCRITLAHGTMLPPYFEPVPYRVFGVHYIAEHVEVFDAETDF